MCIKLCCIWIHCVHVYPDTFYITALLLSYGLGQTSKYLIWILHQKYKSSSAAAYTEKVHKLEEIKIYLYSWEFLSKIIWYILNLWEISSMVYIFTCHLFFLLVFLHFRQRIVKEVYQQVAKTKSPSLWNSPIFIVSDMSFCLILYSSERKRPEPMKI